ncbi:transcription elongation factor GreA [Desulfosporosinus acididurans]|uniref:Transcription elongation factor GreA n=1 Tax=Desulfosporosinus acididurans TaxID=476652 RepID=A0A0J1FJQ2_9FIRM|nr:transcription elongation factor GreA [Desulfosporosinus acididurans]KLU63665.1 transcription elongation factor GreA [Desulfosporosinus acididurans]
MAENETILTAEGLKQLEEELEVYKTVKRKEVAGRIKQAIDFGDISENSEYDDAKDEQAFIETRIIALEKMLGNVKVIRDVKETDVVTLGAKVLLRDVEFDDEEEYYIVGSVEADPDTNKISNESPVGRAVLGKSKGSIVNVSAPSGFVQYQILDIS